eukprot:CAMPEP_0182945348 /NCGR_PEP_ID=MMETSP0105_2-20130417/55400_1 /TAXON_ID=81532 ORGANISM="Acanthoeca-like sp., Strain 10tr" /NCGR_SAMPLE_ID=MMETSP0105_2 /ASSEMBLY_ACC=CAM_ASM_000205 /LENGTH=49 /DNA_ID=CAMNT_0025085365 /DNA_START=401 /DNA_END=550 /DNA_ORIENTATION=-
MTVQSIALILMCRLFFTRSSDYYKISSIANAGTFVGLTQGPPPSSKATD